MQLDRPDVAVLVADESGDVIGYAYATVGGYDYMALCGPAGVLHDVFVDPGYRGRGVGRLLLDAALAFLKVRGAPRVVLTTAEGNQAAQRLFARAGFRRTMVEMTRELHGDPPERCAQRARSSRSEPRGDTAPARRNGDFCNQNCIDCGGRAARAHFNWRTSAATIRG